ncbi:hypothetical protein CEE37_00520 [candidate division LCP-89 bacterium B3_LCP]|uniref:Uncharacterized protein n=1 Tax=candidate division LCP-89 bacterium B3_LCP TaxID=2012998 RepID=A0A532V4S2_UNCL8|nr:MAG: hypothetical protein CEE37_00520 [candidate division LCP-89 bacterium B3_LCP]
MDTEPKTLGLLTLTPNQSKMLIAEAVATHPAVRRALEEGTIVISLGTTNSFVASRLLGEEVDPVKFSAGIIRRGELDVTAEDDRLEAVILQRGERIKADPYEIIEEFGREDVLIKGGNAVDSDGLVGVLLASRSGGTMGKSLGIIRARGSTLLMPIGLEKLIPSVPEATYTMGLDRIGISTGEKAGLMPVMGATIITELQAFKLLTGARATMVAAGGWEDTQGSVTLTVSGKPPQVEMAIQWAQFVKGHRSGKPI